jgi:hypothetical protein
MQNASCGVRTLIACQLRFSTSTIDLFRMSVIKLSTRGDCSAGEVFVLVEFELAAAVGNAPTLPVSETGVQTSTLSGKLGSPSRSSKSEGWSLGKVLPLRFLGVGQT